MSMPKGHKAEKGYATVTDFPGALDYRAIAEKMSDAGDQMNHSTARNVFLRAMKKLAQTMHQHYDLSIEDGDLAHTARDPEFQQGIYEAMIDMHDEVKEGVNQRG